jgi:hypothetical protein
MIGKSFSSLSADAWQVTEFLDQRRNGLSVRVILCFLFHSLSFQPRPWSNSADRSKGHSERHFLTNVVV